MRACGRLLECNKILNLSDLREHINLITQFRGTEDEVVEIVGSI